MRNNRLKVRSYPQGGLEYHTRRQKSLAGHLIARRDPLGQLLKLRKLQHSVNMSEVNGAAN